MDIGSTISICSAPCSFNAVRIRFALDSFMINNVLSNSICNFLYISALLVRGNLHKEFLSKEIIVRINPGKKIPDAQKIPVAGFFEKILFDECICMRATKAKKSLQTRSESEFAGLILPESPQKELRTASSASDQADL